MSAAKRKFDINYDPYKILGIESSSSDKDIDRAFKKLALKWHPDKNADNLVESQKKFIQLYKAYEFLKDKAKKTEFDEVIAAKKKRAVYEDQRKSTSSAKRKYFIDKLNEKEKASEPRPSTASKPTKKETDTEEALTLKRLRREGAQLLKQMDEQWAAAQVAAKKKEEEQKQKEHAEATAHPQAHMYNMSLDEMAALEDEILGI